MAIAHIDNHIAAILDSIPELTVLNPSLKSRANEFMERRFGFLGQSIANSPYDPCKQKDPLGINRDFAGAVREWLHQFPVEQRLGLLVVALSTIYITKPEMDVMLDIAYERLRQTLSDWEGLQYNGSLDSTLVPYAASDFSEFSEFLHRTQLSGMRDRSVRPYRTLDELLATASNRLRMVADDVSVYDDENIKVLEQLIHALLNHHMILLEDCSFSGTRIRTTRNRVLRLMDVLFSPYESILRTKGFRPPTLCVLVICGTSIALTALGERPLTKIRHGFVFGTEFDKGNRAIERIPDTAEEFSADIGMAPVKLHSRLVSAIDWFWEHFGRHYVNATRVETTAKFNSDELRWGYGGQKAGGWSVVTHHNCPNNSLMPLWYPHTHVQESGIRSLFPRIESHIDHSDPAGVSFGDAMDIVETDSKKRVSRALTDIYGELP